MRALAALAPAAALCVSPVPGGAQGFGPEEAMPAYERCLAEGRGDCAGILAAFCLDTADSLSRLTACRAEQAALLEARAAELTERIARNGAQARRAAIEAARGAERSIRLNCAEYAARVPEADTVHHRVRCALLAAHAAVARLTRLLAEQEIDL